MGHIINPVGTHVGVSYSWKFKFLSYRKCDYKYYVDLQHFFNNFFVNFFNDEGFKEIGVLFLFLKLLISRGFVNLLVYVQDSYFSSPLRVRWRRIISRILKKMFLSGDSVVITEVGIRDLLRSWYKTFGSVLFNHYVKCFFWFAVKRIALNYLLLFFPKIDKTSNFYIFALSNSSNSVLFFNATLISRYFIRKLTHRHKLKNLTRPVIRFLSASPVVKGFKLTFSGRFSREERATYEWHKRGVVSLNKFSDLVEYDNAFTSLKFGCVCVKVWLNYDHSAAETVLNRKNFNLTTF